MPGRNIIVVGASAGGVQVLQELMRVLPHDLPAAVFVVVHTSPSSPGVLPMILERAGTLPAAHAFDGEAIVHGRIYVAPPDHHLLIKKKMVRVVRGPRENGFRPAVDPLFRTAARSHGAAVVGVILSGSLDDGTLGLTVIKECGGVAIVQDPAEADFPSMPLSAVQNVAVDHIAPITEIGTMIDRLARQVIPKGVLAMAKCETGEGPDVAEVGSEALQSGVLDKDGTPSRFTCPECGGALWEMKGGRLMRFRCHVGHGYTADTLVADQTAGLEAALWSALRALDEHASLRHRMAERARKGPMSQIAHEYERQATDAESRAALIRGVLVTDSPKKLLKNGGAAARNISQKAKRAKERPVPKSGAARATTGRKSVGIGKKPANGRTANGAPRVKVARAHAALATNRRTPSR